MTPFKHLMQEAAFSARYCANKQGVSVETIYSWLQGKRNAPEDVLIWLQKEIKHQTEVARDMVRDNIPPCARTRQGVSRKYYAMVDLNAE